MNHKKLKKIPLKDLHTLQVQVRLLFPWNQNRHTGPMVGVLPPKNIDLTGTEKSEFENSCKGSKLKSKIWVRNLDQPRPKIESCHHHELNLWCGYNNLRWTVRCGILWEILWYAPYNCSSLYKQILYEKPRKSRILNIQEYSKQFNILRSNKMCSFT